jgi:signal peptidase I
MVRAVERLGDAEYVVQYYGAVDDFEEITVRDGYIFVMGDNRDNSSDSRCWGQVPVENVKGEALFIFWSGGSEHGFLGNRWNRMLNGVE